MIEIKSFPCILHYLSKTQLFLHEIGSSGVVEAYQNQTIFSFADFFLGCLKGSPLSLGPIDIIFQSIRCNFFPR